MMKLSFRLGMYEKEDCADTSIYGTHYGLSGPGVGHCHGEKIQMPETECV